MDISVVIVNYNVRHFLEQCILSIQAASNNLAVEIIVVDNFSTDGSVSILKKKYSDVKFISNSANVGFAKANNIGVAAAVGNYVLILNPDTVLAEDTLHLIYNYAKTKKKLGVLGVKLIDGSGNFLPESKREIPTPTVAFNKLFGFSSSKKSKYYAPHLNDSESGEVPILVGAFMFLRKKIYNEVQGFDEDYFMYGEDIDLSYKVLQKGYKNYYFSDTKVIHYKGESTLKDTRYLKHFYYSMKLFYKKHFKLNFFYDLWLKFGIESWFLLNYLKLVGDTKGIYTSSKILYIGNNQSIIRFLNDNYKFCISTTTQCIIEISKLVKDNRIDTVVFDNDILTNKQIIHFFNVLKNKNLVFKIHPKTTNFLIGSFNSKQQGFISIFNKY